MKVSNFTDSVPDTSWRELIAAVIIEAAREAAAGDDTARAWFFGSDFPLWAEAVGLDLNGPEFIRSGRYKKARYFHLTHNRGQLKVAGASHKAKARTQ